MVNIKMYLREIRCGGVDWIDLDQDKDQRRALVNTIINFRIPLGDVNAKIGRKIFSNQQLEMKIYTKLIMIMELE
jgi:hypothetical protein